MLLLFQVRSLPSRHSTSHPGKKSSTKSGVEGEGSSQYRPLESYDTADSYTQAFEKAQKCQVTDKRRLQTCDVQIDRETDSTSNNQSVVSSSQRKDNCDSACDVTGETGSLPLISRHSDDTLDMDGPEDSEIFCDSDSRSMYKLEADV